MADGKTIGGAVVHAVRGARAVHAGHPAGRRGPLPAATAGQGQIGAGRGRDVLHLATRQANYAPLPSETPIRQGVSGLGWASTASDVVAKVRELAAQAGNATGLAKLASPLAKALVTAARPFAAALAKAPGAAQSILKAASASFVRVLGRYVPFASVPVAGFDVFKAVSLMTDPHATLSQKITQPIMAAGSVVATAAGIAAVLFPPAAPVLAGIALAAGAVSFVADNWSAIQAGAGKALDWAKGAAGAAWHKARDIAGGVWDGAKGVVGGLLGVFS